MTNLEKFKEVFGITIDDRFLRGQSWSQCAAIDTINSENKCEEYDSCHKCPLFKFWDREYVERTKLTSDEEAYIKNDENATYECGM